MIIYKKLKNLLNSLPKMNLRNLEILLIPHFGFFYLEKLQLLPNFVKKIKDIKKLQTFYKVILLLSILKVLQ